MENIERTYTSSHSTQRYSLGKLNSTIQLLLTNRRSILIASASKKIRILIFMWLQTLISLWSPLDVADEYLSLFGVACDIFSFILPSAPVVCESPMHLLELTSCLIYGGLIGDWMAVRGSYSVSSVPYDHRNMHTNKHKDYTQLGLCVCMHNIKCLVMSSRGH